MLRIKITTQTRSNHYKLIEYNKKIKCACLKPCLESKGRAMMAFHELKTNGQTTFYQLALAHKDKRYHVSKSNYTCH